MISREIPFRQVLPVVELLLQLSDLRDVLPQVPQAAHQGAGQDNQADNFFIIPAIFFAFCVSCIIYKRAV